MAQIGVWDKEYHHFYSVAGWDPNNGDCTKNGGGGPHDPQCCGLDNGPKVELEKWRIPEFTDMLENAFFQTLRFSRNGAKSEGTKKVFCFKFEIFNELAHF